MSSILPQRHQRELPLERLILAEAPGAEAIEMDVLFVGAGPAGLAGAIELAHLVKRDQAAGGGMPDLNIAVLEKAGSLGEHNLSGAVINPRSLRELFPDLKDADFPFRQAVTAESVHYLTSSGSVRIPTPPTMHNAGFYTASICELVRWLGEQAEALGVNLFPGFPVDGLLVEGTAVRGVRTTPSGLDREGQPGSGYQAPTDLTGRVTVLSEGTRGPLAQAWQRWRGVGSANPQIFALGVKEVWKTKRPLDRIIHTMGWPLPSDAFGGSFFYPLGPDQAALGLVVGLDYHDATLDVHSLLQRLKLHPLIRPWLEGGSYSNGGRRRFPRGATTPFLPSGMATGCSSSVTRPVSSTSRRSRGSTTRSSRGSTPRAPSSRPSGPMTCRPIASRRTTGWSTRAISPRTSTGPATCDSRSGTGSWRADSRPG